MEYTKYDDDLQRHINNDFDGVPIELLIDELQKYRNAIRYVRNQKGDDRCWRDLVKLYCLLPEGYDEDLYSGELPPAEQFLPNCALNCLLFWKYCQPGGPKSIEAIDEAVEKEYKEILENRQK